MTFLCLPGTNRAPFRSRAITLNKTSLTRVDLPDPLTPVTAIMVPSGKSTVTLRRLCSAAPCTVITRSDTGRRTIGTSIARAPDKYCPVIDAGSASKSARVPLTTISPPCSPAPGPMSTIQSAVRIVSSSCSTTISVLPKSLSLIRVSINR